MHKPLASLRALLFSFPAAIVAVTVLAAIGSAAECDDSPSPALCLQIRGAMAARQSSQASRASAAGAGSTCAAYYENAPRAFADIDAAVPSVSDLSRKVDARDFPSIFMAWTPAAGLSDEENFARHDLIWRNPVQMRLPSNSPYPGLATAYAGTPALQAARGANPRGILLAEVRAHAGWLEDDGNPSHQYLPKGHPWWGGINTGGTSTIPSFLLRDTDPCFQRQVALQCQAAVRSGLFDGCFLDWYWLEDQAHVDILRQVREAVGPNALIVVNSLGKAPAGEYLQYINGVFAEGFGSSFWPGGRGQYDHVPYPSPEAWKALIEHLQTLKRGARRPQVNAIEGWGDEDDLPYMRSLTTAVLAYSDDYVLYSRPNKTVPDHDHTHVWTPFWNKGLGRPLTEDAPVPLEGGAVQREFSGGTVVFNPGNASVHVRFKQPRLSRATGRSSTDQDVAAHDGDIFIKQ